MSANHGGFTPCEQKVYGNVLNSFCHLFRDIRNKRVLDIGCGNGSLGAYLEAAGNECYGITVSKKEAQMAKTQIHSVQQMDIEQVNALPFSDNYFDVVLFTDVLEHLRDPQRVLNLVKPYLKSEALVIASIPNVANVKVRSGLFFGKFDYEQVGILDETHLRFYTLKSAKSLVQNACYAVQHIRFTNWNWNLPKWIRKCFSFCEWEIRDRMTRWFPGLFATQFVIYAIAPVKNTDSSVRDGEILHAINEV